ncbi:Ribosomal RNA large subunit methyltransferase N [Waddlia chondrophila 2032/99]|uniref:Probable dual-specificity RNA methyltransferase RlmN n=2 Tax=Waddlia chondrophila TaxID=71667 RepID=D6YVX5_WADCW|nr:23S rRNA (adenine(2503)-C(2))-methyltransferase RlmN [Waddlia chondrophila]ADI38286.1 Radical SAM superfamily protein [Waddlia chondrophila WSU 86-1044]CCB91368.1 Ribosomal RNA large subunit methyltransferase N [Waddlia chondrophila 2032/99]
MNSAFDLSREEWQKWAETNGLPRFVSSQILQWIYEKGVVDPAQFSNLSLKARKFLASQFKWELPAIHSHLVSVDQSEKFLLRTSDHQLFEMVLMPYESRITLCISSQVGCRIGCTFCQTGKLGLQRNLTSGEILSQILLANQSMNGKKITNIVFMGMGEPLDNYDEVLKACRLMVDPKAIGLSMHRVTVSTSGLVPYIEKLGQDLPVRLAISLHQADDEKRSRMMPVNRRYPLSELKKALQQYPAPKRYGITFEYVMIEGENDRIEDAKKLVKFVSGLKAKVNLIPINHFPGLEMKASAADRLKSFQSYLAERSIPAPVRYSRGQDISGGCGQLAAKTQEELNMDPRVLRRQRKQSAFAALK